MQQQDPQIEIVVRQAIEVRLQEGKVSMEKVAELLGVSSRTLQRRLKHRSVTFNELLDEVRIGRAEDLIAEGLNMDEVAKKLQYSSRASLYHLCKRTRSMQPAEMKRIQRVLRYLKAS